MPVGFPWHAHHSGIDQVDDAVRGPGVAETQSCRLDQSQTRHHVAPKAGPLVNLLQSSPPPPSTVRGRTLPALLVLAPRSPPPTRRRRSRSLLISRTRAPPSVLAPLPSRPHLLTSLAFTIPCRIHPNISRRRRLCADGGVRPAARRLPAPPPRGARRAEAGGPPRRRQRLPRGRRRRRPEGLRRRRAPLPPTPPQHR